MSTKSFSIRKSHFSKRSLRLEALESRELLSVTPLGGATADYVDYATYATESNSVVQIESAAAPIAHEVWANELTDAQRGEVDTITLNLVFNEINTTGADIVYEIWYTKSPDGPYATWFDTGVRATLISGQSAITDETALKVEVDVNLLTQGSGEYGYFTAIEAGLGQANMLGMEEYATLDFHNGVLLPPPGRFAETMPTGSVKAEYSPFATLVYQGWDITIDVSKAFTGLNPSLYYFVRVDDGVESDWFRSCDSTVVIYDIAEPGTYTLYLYAESVSGVIGYTEPISKMEITIEAPTVPANCPAVKSVTASDSGTVGMFTLDVQFAATNNTGVEILYEVWYAKGNANKDLSSAVWQQCSTTVRLKDGQSVGQALVEYGDVTYRNNDYDPNDIYNIGDYVFFYVIEPVLEYRTNITNVNTALVSAPIASPQQLGTFHDEYNMEYRNGLGAYTYMDRPGKFEINVQNAFSNLSPGAYYRVDAVLKETNAVAGSSPVLLYTGYGDNTLKMTIDNLTVEGYYTLYLYACDAQGNNIYSRPLSIYEALLGDPWALYPHVDTGVDEFEPGRVDHLTVHLAFDSANTTGTDLVYEIWYTKSNDDANLQKETWFDSGVRVTMKAGHPASVMTVNVAMDLLTEGLGDYVYLQAMIPGQGKADLTGEYSLGSIASALLPPDGRFKSTAGITTQIDPEAGENGLWTVTVDINRTFTDLDPSLYYYIEVALPGNENGDRTELFRSCDSSLQFELYNELGPNILYLYACNYEGATSFSLPISMVEVNFGAVPGDVDLTGGATVTGLTTGGATVTLPKISGAKSYTLYLNGTVYVTSSKNTFTLTDLNSRTQYGVSYSTDKDATIKSVGSFTTLNGGTASDVTVGAPTTVKFAAVKNGSSKITWKAPANYTGGYNVIVTVDGSGTVYEIAPGAKLEYTLTGIDAHKVYEIVVVADTVNAIESTPVYINKSNTPAWTDINLPTTGAWPTGGKVNVIKPSLAMVGGHLQANWGVSIPPLGTSVISRIVLKDAGGSVLDAVYVYNNVNNETWTFDNITLTPGMKYTVDVYAVHLAADFTEDYTSKAGSGTITVPAYPVATAKVSNISLGGATVTVTPGKNAPTDNYYYVEYTNVADAKGKPDWSSASVVALTGGNLSTTLSGLKQGTQYYTRVVAADQPDGQWSGVTKVATGKDVKFKTVAVPLATIAKPGFSLVYNAQNGSFDLAMNFTVKDPDISKLRDPSLSNTTFDYQLICSQGTTVDKATGVLVGATQPFALELSEPNAKGERSLEISVSLTGTGGVLAALGLDMNNLTSFKNIGLQLVTSYVNPQTGETYATSYSKAGKLTMPKWFS